MRKAIRGKLFAFIKGAAIVYLLLLALMYFGQGAMTYISRDSKPDITDAKIPGLEEIIVQTEDGLSLFGWYKKPAKGKPVIVWFHGNASNVLWHSYRTPPYILKGYGVLLVEYRGYSANPGKPSEENLYKDARAFIEWIRDRGFAEKEIIFYAESLGTGVAVQMATEYPDIAAMILESPFTSMQDLAAHHYWFIPVRFLMKDQYDSAAKIGGVKAPLIVVHGDKDSMIPYRYGEALFQKANKPKTLLTIEGADHNDLGNYDIAPEVLKMLEKKANTP